MRKGATFLFALALLLVLATSGANAWVRAKMYDGVVPFDPEVANAEYNGWHDADSGGTFSISPGEIVGGRVACKYTFASGGNSKLKYQPTGTFATDKVTSFHWSFYIDGGSTSYRCPQVQISLDTDPASGVGGKAVKFSYTNIVAAPGNNRGWYIQVGNVTSGGVQISDKGLGLPMEPGQWHSMRLTLDPTTGTWDMWLDDGLGGHISGTVGSIGDKSYIQWPRIDRSSEYAQFWIGHAWWGQGIDEIDPIPGSGAQWDMTDPVITVAPDGTYADITWTTENPSDTRVVWGKDFYSFPNNVTVNESVTNHSYRITGLQPNATYTVYCTSSDATRTWASGVKQFRTPLLLTSTLGNPGFEEGAWIYPWIDSVPPSSPETQRWGGNFHQYITLLGPLLPRTGQMWSGSVTASYAGRDWACIRQQVAVTPGRAYKATVWFCDVFNPGGNQWAYTDAMGRIGLDPKGGTEPGYIAGSDFVSDPDIYWSPWTYTNQIGIRWNQASTLCVAEPATPPEQPKMTIYLQHHYAAHPWVYLAFDDVDFAEGPLPPTTCAGAKNWTPGWQVTLDDVVVTLRQGLGDIVGYVEDADSKSGIRVQCSEQVWPDTIGVGDSVDVAGQLQINENKELYIEAKSIVPSSSSATVYARGMSNAMVGGAALGRQVGVEGGSGANNIGLLVRTWGRVTAVYPPDSFEAFSVFIDDGSNLTAGVDGSTTTYPGIEVRIPANAGLMPWDFTPGQTYILVTGVSSMKTWQDPVAGPVQKRQILIRNSDDIRFSIL
jgi:hypothetical protein